MTKQNLIKTIFVAIILSLGIISLAPAKSYAAADVSLEEIYDIIKFVHPDQVYNLYQNGIFEQDLIEFIGEIDCYLQGRIETYTPPLTEEQFKAEFKNSIIDVLRADVWEGERVYDSIYSYLNTEYGIDVSDPLSIYSGQSALSEEFGPISEVLMDIYVGTGEMGKINIDCLARLGLEYGNKSGETGFYDIHDLKNDGLIDLFDLVILSRNMGNNITAMLTSTAI